MSNSFRADINLNGNKYEHHMEIIDAIENRDLTLFQTKSSFIIYLMYEGLKSVRNKNAEEKTTERENQEKDNDSSINNQTVKEENYDDYDIGIDDFDFENFT